MRYHEIINEAEGPKFSNSEYSKFPDLMAAIRREWGDIGDLERVRVSNKGSSMGFILGRNHLVDSKTGKVVGFWETTGADSIPGRGTVTSGYGAVALKPTTSKAPPKAEPKPEPEEPASKDEIRNATGALYSKMKQTSTTWTRFDGLTDTGFHVRHWGNWEVPEGEEDDGDYDWEVLTDESNEKLDAIVDSIQRTFPNVKIEVLGSEKNWLEIRVSSHL